jgi:hypothetical protein
VSVVSWADGDEVDGEEGSYGGERTEGSEQVGTPDVVVVEDEGERSELTGSRKRSREPEGVSSMGVVQGASSLESVKEEVGEEVRGATPVGPYQGGSMDIGPGSSSRKSSEDGMGTEDDSSKPLQHQQEQEEQDNEVKVEAADAGGSGAEGGGAGGGGSTNKALAADQAASLVAKLGSQRINNIFTHLRKLCQHPLLIRQHFSDEIVSEMAEIATRNRLFGGNCTLPRVLQELRGEEGGSASGIGCQSWLL